MGTKPKFSVVTPSYNCAAFVRECIESVLAQGYDNFEHIVVDGASTDGTVEILKRYPHLKWISEPDRGEAEALNKGLRMVSGDIIGWLNADDCYVDGTFQKVVEVMCSNPKSDLVYGKTVFIDEKGIPTNWAIPYVPLNLVTLTRWFRLDLFQPSIFFTKKVFRDVGFFREDLQYGVDYEYWLRTAAKGYSFLYLDQVLAKAMIYRSGGKSKTPYVVKAKEWLEICKTYLPYLTRGEQIHFWRDYYTFRLRMHSSAFYYNNAPIEMPRTAPAISGFILALKDLSLIHGKLIDPILQSPLPDSANLMGIIAEHLRQVGRPEEARKAFEWALALESRDPVVLHRFAIHSKADIPGVKL